MDGNTTRTTTIQQKCDNLQFTQSSNLTVTIKVVGGQSSNLFGHNLKKEKKISLEQLGDKYDK